MCDESAMIWAEREFGGAELGDKRRTERLVKTAAGRAMNPDVGMTTCCGKNDAQLISRLLARDELTMDSTLEAHKKRTVERCSGHKTVYAVQDTTNMDLTSHKALKGIGPVCQHDEFFGLLLHTTIAVSRDRTPLGILDANIWGRESKVKGKKKNSAKEPIENKESFKWVRGKRSADELLNDVCQVVIVGDRESDIFELFADSRGDNVDLLIRAHHNRKVKFCEEMDKLFNLMNNSEVLGEYLLKIPRRKDKAAREAVIEVKAGTALIMPHRYLKEKGLETPISINWVYAREKNSTSADAIDWKLLTTLSVKDFSEAKSRVDEYSNRWIIEEYHRVLKSGCKVEGLQFETLDSMYPAFAICFVVAWRLLFLSKYARENPDGDASLVSTGTERKVLSNFLKIKKKEKNWKIKTIQDFVKGVAKLGGYLGRKKDGPPGTKTLWLGLRRLSDLVNGYLLALEIQKSSEV